VRTTLEVGRVSVIGPFNCFRMASSYEAIVVTEYFGCTGDEADDDELMDAVLLELQIQIGVGEAAGTPMLRCDDLAWLRLELGTDLASPRAVPPRQTRTEHFDQREPPYGGVGRAVAAVV